MNRFIFSNRASFLTAPRTGAGGQHGEDQTRLAGELWFDRELRHELSVACDAWSGGHAVQGQPRTRM